MTTIRMAKLAAFLNLILLFLLISYCQFIRHTSNAVSPSRYLMLPAGALYAVVGGAIWLKGTANAKEMMNGDTGAKLYYWLNQIYPTFWLILFMYSLKEAKPYFPYAIFLGH
jgi:hypothetical protein